MTTTPPHTVSWQTWLTIQFARASTTAHAYFSGLLTAHPTSTLHIPSRDPGRSIKAHLYASTVPVTGPRPLLINAHGSGFVVPLHGSDDAFCAHVAATTPFSVLDTAYRLAPEHPFPAGLHDVADVLAHARTAPEFAGARIALSGFSAGANLVLAAAVTAFPPDAFVHVLAIYPPCDIATPPAQRVAPERGGRALPQWLVRAFDESYLPPGTDKAQAGVSPFYAEDARFSRALTFVTAGLDSLSGRTEELGARLARGGRDVVVRRFGGVEHGFDKERAEPESVAGRAVRDMFALATDRIGGSVDA